MSSKGRPRADDGGPGLQLVPGERAVRELLEHAPARIERLLVLAGGRLDPLRAQAKAAGVVVDTVDAAELRRRAPTVDARGVLALARPRPLADLEDLLPDPDSEADAAEPEGDRRRLWLALDGVVDPQNLGAILRTAEFFGVEGVFWPRDRAVGVTPAVVRASAGASERIPLASVTNLARALGQFRDAGAWIVGTVPEGGRTLADLATPGELPTRLVVVMGSEARGMRRLTAEHCDFLATIPRRGAVASLNVAAATAVVLSALA